MRKFIFILLSCFLFIPFTSINAATPKSWTFLIFINGNNNLDSYGEQNIIDMEKVGSNDQVNIVVQWASMSAQKTVRLLVQKSDDSSQVTSPILEDLGVVDMGSYQTLEDFIKWGVDNFPADHYFIDIWDHGGGWHLKNTRRAFNVPVIGDISWDENTGNFITTEQLGDVMAYAAKAMGHKVDLYGSDACLMGMAEVANQMSDSVSFSVGSEETEPGAGWPYNDFLQSWYAKPNATAQDVAKSLVDTYVASYQGKEDVTMSAFDLSQIKLLNKTVKQLGSDIQSLNAKNRKSVMAASSASQRYAYADYVDLGSLVKNIKAAKVKIDDKDLQNVEDAISKFVIANADTSAYAKSKGVSVWLPTTKYDYKVYSDRYKKLVFNGNTKWNDTITFLLNH